MGLNHPHPPTPSPLSSEGESKSPLYAMDSGGGASDWLTYTFDRAVWMWGQWVESKLAERDAHGQAVWSWERILAEADPFAAENVGGADQLLALVGEGVRVKP